MQLRWYDRPIMTQSSVTVFPVPCVLPDVTKGFISILTRPDVLMKARTCVAHNASPNTSHSTSYETSPVLVYKM